MTQPASFIVEIKRTTYAEKIEAAKDGPALVLEYRFLEGMTQIASVAELIDCYRHVLGGTSVRSEIVDCMLPLWLHGQMRGDPRLEEAAFGPLATEGISFSWPWFSEWLERFRKEKLLPVRWEPLADQIKDRRLGFRHERIPLLAHTLARLVYNRMRAEQQVGYADVRRAGSGRFQVSSECEASRTIAEERLPLLVPGDWRTYPPYFPGDTSSIHWVRD